MDSQHPSCVVCGGTEYAVEAGFYYCKECQTQSQDIREEVFETFLSENNATSGSSVTKKKRRRKTDINTEREWTTWEAYNWILKGMVDEMIDLGAKPSLKVIVLQLWTCYLKKLEVAFISKSKQELPNLSPIFDVQDASLVTGIKFKSRKGGRSFTSKKSASSEFSSATVTSDSGFDIRKRFIKHKKALMAAEAKQVQRKVDETLDFSSQLEQSLRERETASSDKETVVSCSSQKSSCRSRKGLEERKHILSKFCRPRRKYRPPKSFADVLHRSPEDPFPLNRTKMLNFIHLGLLLNCDQQQLSDVLRWIHEGRLSFQHVTHFFPEEALILSYDRTRFGKPKTVPYYASLNNGSGKLAEFLGVKYIPLPDLSLLVQRQVRELGLPDMMVSLVTKLNETIPVLPFIKGSTKFCCYEVQTMAMIIFLLKLLFGLDDRTEHKISGFAKQMNKLRGEDMYWLFDWDSWVSWVERRKQLLAKYHTPTRDKVNPGGNMDTEQLVDQWKRGFKDYRRIDALRDTASSESRAMKPSHVEIIKESLLQLVETKSPVSTKMYFPCTLTPQSVYSNIIIENGPSNAQGILTKSFHASDMGFLLNPSEVIQFASTKNIKIIVLEKSAHSKFKRIKVTSNKRSHHRCSVISVVPDSVPLYSSGKKTVLKKSYKPLTYPLQAEGENFEIGDVGHIVPPKHSGTIDDNYGKSNVAILSINETHPMKNQKSENESVTTFKRKRRRRRKNMDTKETLLSDGSIENIFPVVADNETIDTSSMKSKTFLNFHLELLSKNCPLTSKTRYSDYSSVLEKSELNLLTKADRKYFVNIKKKLWKEAACGNLKRLKLYLPCKDYWVYGNCLQMERILQTDFKRIMGTMPLSFTWLLTECARSLEVDERSLYCELLQIEAMASYIQNRKW